MTKDLSVVGKNFPILTIQTSFFLLYRAVLDQCSYQKTISFIVSVGREGSFLGVTSRHDSLTTFNRVASDATSPLECQTLTYFEHRERVKSYTVR